MLQTLNRRDTVLYAAAWPKSCCLTHGELSNPLIMALLSCYSAGPSGHT